MGPDPTSFCDLLIVGAGPAGLLAATWAAHCGIRTRIVEKRGNKIFHGQADGLQCRTMEIFDSFGFVHRVLNEACLLYGKQTIINRFPANEWPKGMNPAIGTPGVSRFQEYLLEQGRIESFLLDSLKEHSTITVERSVLPEELQLDSSLSEDADAYPITLKVRHLADDEVSPNKNGSSVPNGLFRSNLVKDDEADSFHGSRKMVNSSETIRAKYMIGCDGAHSWTRRQLGISMVGEQTDYVWGVLDIIPITDFPDIRSRCAIQSANAGSIMIIPRERRLVRLYVQLSECTPTAGQRVDRLKITPELILKAAQDILSPYKITYDYCEWWTGYQVGQRVANRFSVDDRIFLAGDAVHTHSPKAGQGMNVSMQDTYNLGWKLASVINGFARRSILKTYESERWKVAHALIEFDHRISRLFSEKPTRDASDSPGTYSGELKQAYRNGSLFTCGLATGYGASMLIAKPKVSVTCGNGLNGSSDVHEHLETVGKPELALNIPLGERFPSYQVLNQSDGAFWQFAHWLPSDGRFRVILFAGNLLAKQQWQRVVKFGEEIASPDSFLRRFTPSSKAPGSVIELLTIHSARRTEIELLDLPEVFHPFDEKLGWDYNKVFVDDASVYNGHGEAYKRYGVDRERGCVVIARPDQHVAWIGDLEDVHEIDRYFSAFLIPQE